MAVRDQDLLSEVQWAAIEPADGGASWPSGLWTRDEVLGYLNQRQDRLLRDSLLLIGIANLAVVSEDLVNANTGFVDLPADWQLTTSVVWRGEDGTVKELLRVDSFQADHSDPAWARDQDTTPLVYLDHDAPHQITRIAPIPTVDGTLELWYVPLGSPLNGAEILTVPDELAPALKYGTLADMLAKDGRARDAARAEYAEMRFQLGIDAARLILEGWA